MKQVFTDFIHMLQTTVPGRSQKSVFIRVIRTIRVPNCSTSARRVQRLNLSKMYCRLKVSRSPPKIRKGSCFNYLLR